MASVDTYINGAIDISNELSETAIDAMGVAVRAAGGSPKKATAKDVYASSGIAGEYDTDNLWYASEFNQPAPVGDLNLKSDVGEVITPVFPVAPDINIRDFTRAEPDINAIKPFTAVAPDIDTDFTHPVSPDIQNILQPVLDNITLGDAPDIVLPAFDADLVLRPIGDPPDAAQDFEDRYNDSIPEFKALVDQGIAQWQLEYAPELHTGLAQLEAKLKGITDGSEYAVGDVFEQALYTRARSKVEAERERVEEDLVSSNSKRGFRLPPGALSAGRNRAHQAAADNLATQSTEIYIERTKIEIQHLQFAMNLSQGVRQMLLGASLQYADTMVKINDQAIKYGQIHADFLVKVFNQLLDLARLDVQIYQAKAQVFEVKLKAALATMEAYKLEIEVAKTKNELNQARVAVYTAQINAENTKINIYVAQIKAVAELAGLERLKVEIYQAEAGAYNTAVQGSLAQANVYKALVAGDIAQLQVQSTKADVYKTQVDAKAAEGSFHIANAQMRVGLIQSEISEYKARISAYEAVLRAEGVKMQSASAAWTATEQARGRVNEAIGREAEQSFKNASLRTEAHRATAMIDIQADIANQKAFSDHARLLAGTANDTARISAQMAGAALGAQNTMISQIETA